MTASDHSAILLVKDKGLTLNFYSNVIHIHYTTTNIGKKMNGILHSEVLKVVRLMNYNGHTDILTDQGW